MRHEQIMSDLVDTFMNMCERYNHRLADQRDRILGHYDPYIDAFTGHPDVQDLKLLLDLELELISDEATLVLYGDRTAIPEFDFEKLVNEADFLISLDAMGVPDAQCEKLSEQLWAERLDDAEARRLMMQQVEYFQLCIQDVKGKLDSGLLDDAERVKRETEKRMNELYVSRSATT